MAYLIAGPLVALVGIVAVFFVLRRKSVEKRSMYSARRSQIEHKVRAARQRTLTPRGHSERPAEHAGAAASAYAPTQIQQTATYEAPAYEPPPAAAPAAPPSRPEAPPPWETTSAPPQVSSFDFPAAPPEPAYAPPASEPFRPAPEPTPMPAPSEQVWTPAPAPAKEPVAPLEPVASSASVSGGSWSVVSSEKDPAIAGDGARKKSDGGPTGSWQLASGDAPGLDADKPSARAASKT